MSEALREVMSDLVFDLRATGPVDPENLVRALWAANLAAKATGDPLAADFSQAVVAIGNAVADVFDRWADQIDLACNTAGSA